MVSKAIALLIGAVLSITLLLTASIHPPHAPVVLGSYATDLVGRTPNQQFNARRAARLLDGVVVLPGQVFSYNKALGGWSREKGYRRAPVSYNGILVDEYGGGVCQTSTTLYNAALLAGLPIVERHSHTFAPSYAPAGRDAAVAYENVDLRFRNNNGSPIIIHASTEESFVTCSIVSFKKPTARCSIESKILDIFPAPIGYCQPGISHSRSRWNIRGRDGVRVATYRTTTSLTDGTTETTLVSDNTYRPITAAVWEQ